MTRKRIRGRGLLRILKQKPYEPSKDSFLPDQYLLDSVLGATPSVKLYSILQGEEIEYPSWARAYFPYSD